MDEKNIRDSVYITENINDLKIILEDRIHNKNQIESKQEEVLGDKFIAPIKNTSRYAVLSRSLASPNIEQLRFLKIARLLKLKPIILEYDGKFVTKNIEKLSLFNMKFYKDDSFREYKNPHTIKIANTNENQGKYISNINTNSGNSLKEFHRDLINLYEEYRDCEVFDFTEWFNETRVMGPSYYFFFLSQFLNNAVLFDNYILSDKEESRFLIEKILPSISQIENIFNLKPLIYPLLPYKNEADEKWLSYEHKVELYVNSKNS